MSQPGMHARLSRAHRFGKLVTGLVVGSVVFMTALAYWFERLGVIGLAVVGTLGFLTLLAVLALPESAWQRLTASPEAQKRVDAVEALTASLVESDAIRDRWFEDVPPPVEEMEREADEWLNAALSVLMTHAPEYRADFLLKVSHPRVRVRTGEGHVLSNAQTRVLTGFDSYRKKLGEILAQVRRA